MSESVFSGSQSAGLNNSMGLRLLLDNYKYCARMAEVEDEGLEVDACQLCQAVSRNFQA